MGQGESYTKVDIGDLGPIDCIADAEIFGDELPAPVRAYEQACVSCIAKALPGIASWIAGKVPTHPKLALVASLATLLSSKLVDAGGTNQQWQTSVQSMLLEYQSDDLRGTLLADFERMRTIIPGTRDDRDVVQQLTWLEKSLHSALHRQTEMLSNINFFTGRGFHIWRICIGLHLIVYMELVQREHFTLQSLQQLQNARAQDIRGMAERYIEHRKKNSNYSKIVMMIDMNCQLIPDLDDHVARLRIGGWQFCNSAKGDDFEFALPMTFGCNEDVEVAVAEKRALERYFQRIEAAVVDMADLLESVQRGIDSADID